MARTRLSTTVDSDALERARSLVGGRDSELLDAALNELIEREEQRREMRAIDADPYSVDPELALPPADVDWDRDMPYDGEVPAEVVDLARRRRAARS